MQPETKKLIRNTILLLASAIFYFFAMINEIVRAFWEFGLVLIIYSFIIFAMQLASQFLDKKLSFKTRKKSKLKE